MQLDQLKLRNFRCFSDARLDFHPELNWIVGLNASGKTSLLEALFFLGHGRSFRTARPDRLIREGEDGFELVARLSHQGRPKILGIGRNDSGTQARLAGETLQGMAEAAKALPVVVLDSGMNHLVSGGPGERRRWLDWGVFHVEHRFLATWKKYQQALKQRNQALRNQVSERSLAPWTQAVAQAGEEISELRRLHFESILPTFIEYVGRALPSTEIEMAYRRGWSRDESLSDVLAKQLQRDREVGSTRAGPHRADVDLRIDGLPAEERLSRGQQKMLAGALWLAHVKVFTCATSNRPLLLVDDLAAELDGEHLTRFLGLLQDQDAQQVLTAIVDADIARTGLDEGNVFHVEHGKIG